MTDTVPDLLSDAIADYARRLHGVIGDTHHVASPLGAWLVLAMAAPAAQGEDRERLAEVLGMPVADAARTAGALLEQPHPVVVAAAAAWSRVAASGALGEWLDGLPAAVDRRPMPTQDEADAWTRDSTLGLIETFPIGLAESVFVLVSALATRISWSRPFDVVDAAEFRSDWRDTVTTVLRSPEHGHRCAIVGHDGVGDLAVHHGYAEGMTVTSVIAAADVPAAQVLAAAHDVARDRVQRYSLFDLPLGDGPSWTITESAGEDRRERLSAVLPAWSAQSRHDLTDPRLGFAEAASAIMSLVGDGPWEAAQAAVARYHREGFEAAAVTAMAVATSARMPRPGRQRAALLRFDRPYAVVATAEGAPGPWRGLPVFSAWVAAPEDVTGD